MVRQQPHRGRAGADIWLHEGFACYAEWIWSEDAGGPTADALARQHHARLAGLPQDLVVGDPGPVDMFDDRVYKRGALTLHAVRLELGDDAFFALLRRWATDHQHGTVTTDGFVELVEQSAGGRSPGSSTAGSGRRPLPSLTSGAGLSGACATVTRSARRVTTATVAA